jgi:rhomboid protease GluP
MANCVQCGRQLPALSFGKKLCQWCVMNEAAKRGEDIPIQRVEAAPWMRRQSSSMAVTQAIFGINVAVFVAMTLAVGFTVFGSQAWLQLSVRLGANYGPYTLSGQWWRLLACVFIHGGLLHIAFNMWCLWNLGRLAESVYGHWTFAAVYLICGLSASLGSLIWHLSNPVPSVGASGAIFGIAGALISSFYLGEFSLPRAAIGGLQRSVVTFVGYNLFFGAMIGGIDNAAHVGGLLMGLLLGALIAKVAPKQDDFLRRMAVLLIGVLIVAGAVFWLQRSHTYRLYGQNGVELLDRGETDPPRNSTLASRSPAQSLPMWFPVPKPGVSQTEAVHFCVRKQLLGQVETSVPLLRPFLAQRRGEHGPEDRGRIPFAPGLLSLGLIP